MNFSAASFVFTKILPITALFAAGTFSAFSEPIRYSGSDFLAGEPEKALNAAILQATGENAQSKLRGSIAGEKELRNGDADFAVLILPNGGKNLPEVQKGEWRFFPLAYQVAYVVVATANPANEISFKQLASIFGKNAAHNAKNWNEAGVPDFSPTLTPCVGDVSRTDAVTFFQRKVLPNYALRSNVAMLASDANVFKEIVNKPGTVAVVGSPVPAGIPVKTLAVSDDHANANATAYTPSFTNIYNNDYPLTITLYVVYPVKNRRQLKPVLSFLYSQDMADKLSAAGFLALEPKLREQFKKGIDNIR